MADSKELAASGSPPSSSGAERGSFLLAPMRRRTHHKRRFGWRKRFGNYLVSGASASRAEAAPPRAARNNLGGGIEMRRFRVLISRLQCRLALSLARLFAHAPRGVATAYEELLCRELPSTSYGSPSRARSLSPLFWPRIRDDFTIAVSSPARRFASRCLFLCTQFPLPLRRRVRPRTTRLAHLRLRNCRRTAEQLCNPARAAHRHCAAIASWRRRACWRSRLERYLPPPHPLNRVRTSPERRNWGTIGRRSIATQSETSSQRRRSSGPRRT